VLRHVVLFRFAGSTSEATIQRIFDEFADLTARMPGALGVTSGRNISPEKLDLGFKHGFVMDFDSADARDAYLAHPDHVRFAEEEVIPALEFGRDSIVVFDYETT